LSALPPIASKLVELRSVFDRARALSFPSDAIDLTENLLAVRVSGDGYAIRVAEISGLVTGKKIVPIPSSTVELLGVAGIRGALVPVYSLAMLLGYSAETEQARWLALCGTEDPVALAFAEFEGYIRVAPSEIHSPGQDCAARISVKQVVRGTDMVRGVVSIAVLKGAIQRRGSNNSNPKER